MMLKVIMRNCLKRTSTNLQQTNWEHLTILLREIIRPHHVPPIFPCVYDEMEIEEVVNNLNGLQVREGPLFLFC